MQPHDSLIVSLAPSGAAWAGLAFLIMIGVTVYLAASMLHDGEEEIEAAHDMAYRGPTPGYSGGATDDALWEYDPELVRLSDADETARAPLGYMNWHEYDLHHMRERPYPHTAEWWLLMRRLTYEDTQLHRSCPGYIHHHVTRSPDGGYILRASYRATMQAVA